MTCTYFSDLANLIGISVSELGELSDENSEASSFRYTLLKQAREHMVALENSPRQLQAASFFAPAFESSPSVGAGGDRSVASRRLSAYIVPNSLDIRASSSPSASSQNLSASASNLSSSTWSITAVTNATVTTAGTTSQSATSASACSISLVRPSASDFSPENSASNNCSRVTVRTVDTLVDDDQQTLIADPQAPLITPEPQPRLRTAPRSISFVVYNFEFFKVQLHVRPE